MTDGYTRPKSKALFDHIRMDILRGKHTAGKWLKQIELEEQYNATRSDVRAALSSLAERGIVEYVRNRGYRIFDRRPEEIQDIVEMIVVLEAACATAIVERATDKDIEELTALANDFNNLIESGDLAHLRLSNYHFHARLNALTSNQRMANEIRNLRECCAVIPFARYTTFEGLKESNKEHFEIIEAVKQRNAKLLASLIKKHTTHTL